MLGAHPKNQLLNPVVAIVIQFKLCSTRYIALWMYSGTKSASTTNSATYESWDDFYTEATLHLLQINTYVVVGKETGHRGGEK